MSRYLRPIFNSLNPQRQEPVPQDRYCHDASVLAKIIDFKKEDLEVLQQQPERVSFEKTKKFMNWYLPPFDNAFYGGVMTILRFSNYLADFGICPRFIICGAVDTTEILAKIEKAFPNLGNAEVFSFENVEKIDEIPFSEFSAATLWTTAYILLKVRNTGLKFYFIQDFEPLFYPAGSTYAQAEMTYKFGFYGIANTVTLRKIYEEHYGGIATHFKPCVDSDVFYEPEKSCRSTEVKRLFFYGRPGHPRNAFELAAESMKKLKSEHGDAIEIISAGSEWEPADYELEGVVNNYGILEYRETGNLYRTCHIGLSMMMTKHPSYLPFEMMACGVLVISNFNDSTAWFLKDGENCLLSPPSASAIASTLSEAISSYEDFSSIIRTGVHLIKESHSNWANEFENVRQFMFTVSQ